MDSKSVAAPPVLFKTVGVPVGAVALHSDVALVAVFVGINVVPYCLWTRLSITSSISLTYSVNGVLGLLGPNFFFNYSSISFQLLFII